MRRLYNVFVMVIHVLGILFLEAFCMARLVWYYDWSLVEDFYLITAAIIVVGGTFLLENIRKVVFPRCMSILTLFDIITTIPVVYLLLIPNPIMYFSDAGQIILVLLIQLLILAARFFSVIRYRTVDGSTS